MSNTVKYIPGKGSLKSRIILVGEAPGLDEDRAGEPFVGRSGHMLTTMLSYVGLTRADVYLTNVIKVRPTNNRKPSDDEIASWVPLLRSELWAAVQKDVLTIALGSVAAKALMGRNYNGLPDARGKILTTLPGIANLLVTYHPAYLLRSPKAKEAVGDDLEMVKEFRLTQRKRHT